MSGISSAVGGVNPNVNPNPDLAYNAQKQLVPANQFGGLFGGSPQGTQFSYTGQTPPSGYRPTSTSPQFYQPVQQHQYQNYANPQTQMGVSQYGQQPQGVFQASTPFNPYTNSYQQPTEFYGGMQGGMQPQSQMQQMQQPVAQRTSSGPSQAIVSRSAQMRGTPSVMRRAEGGITSLLDNE
jgi:hypothetical protein